MSTYEDPVKTLSVDESWEKLRSHVLGRLVTRVGDVVDVFPVNYVVDGESLVFRTAEGSKLVEITVNSNVLFEVDEYGVVDAWSVVVRGKAQRLETLAEIEQADQLPLKPMVPTLKYNYVRITPDEVTGREFKRGPEPERYGVQPY